LFETFGNMFLITVKTVLFLTKIDKFAVFTVPRNVVVYRIHAKAASLTKLADQNKYLPTLKLH